MSELRVQEKTPAIDVTETATAYTLRADMPGVSRDNLEVELDNDALTVRGTQTPWAPEAAESSHIEALPVTFRRTFAVSPQVQREAILATLKDGVLEVVLPKADAARARKIDVQVA